jgi:hypothetical protein
LIFALWPIFFDWPDFLFSSNGEFMLSKSQSEFLSKLADLCDEYNAGFTYTKDDDGIHVLIDGIDVFADYLDMDAAGTIRKALI